MLVRWRYLCCSCEEKAVRAFLGESGALSALQAADDISHHSKAAQVILENGEDELERKEKRLVQIFVRVSKFFVKTIITSWTALALLL